MRLRSPRRGMTVLNKFTLVAAVVAFALGLGAGWLVFADAGMACWEVRATLEDAQDDMVASLGDEGYGAMRAAAAKAADRPDCFSPEDREVLRQMADTPRQPPPGGVTPGELTVEPTETSTTAG